MAGACIGFLWYNAIPPTSSWATRARSRLGAAIAALAVVTKTELLLAAHRRHLRARGHVGDPAGRVASSCTGKRIFRMAPIHHHFEMKGWSETKVMVRFWIVTGIIAGAGLRALLRRDAAARP